MKKDIGILVFRISLGTLMICHGIMKIMGGWDFMMTLGALPPLVPEDESLHLVLGIIATLSEILGGLGLITGFGFRLACILLTAVMIPAFLYHLESVNDFASLMRNTWPLELAFVFIAFCFIGPGKYKLGS